MGSYELVPKEVPMPNKPEKAMIFSLSKTSSVPFIE